MKIKDLIENYGELELSEEVLKQLGVNVKVDRFEFPKNGEDYYRIYPSGGVCDFTYSNNEFNKDTFVIWNYYPAKHFTREEVEQISKQKFLYNKAIWELKREIERLNDGWVPEWENGNKEKYIIYNEEGEFKCLSWYTCKYMPNWLHLKSRDLCNQLIKTHEKQLKIYFEID